LRSAGVRVTLSTNHFTIARLSGLAMAFSMYDSVFRLFCVCNGLYFSDGCTSQVHFPCPSSLSLWLKLWLPTTML